MANSSKDLSRRRFLELAAVGAAGAAVSGLSVPSALAATPKRGGTVTCGMPWMIQTPDPHRYSGTWGRHAFALAWEGLVDLPGPAERMRITMEKGADAVPEAKPMLADSWDVEKGGQRVVFHLKKNVKFFFLSLRF